MLIRSPLGGRPFRWFVSVRAASLVLLVLALTLPVRADEADRTMESAVRLLTQSVSVERNRGDERLLEALRHLRDPALRPFFTHLAQADTDNPGLRIHGMLGQAELREPEPGLALADLAEIEHPTVQVQLISAALDAELLPLDEAAQLLTWTDLDLGVKLLVALQLIERGQLTDEALLHEALNARRLARRGLAALMLHQLDDAAGTQILQELSDAPDPQREPVQMMLIQAALRHQLHRAGTWGYAVTTQEQVHPRLRLAALKLAMRFGDPRAASLWQQRFESTDDVAERNRLALNALDLAPWVEPSVFEAMAAAAEERGEQAIERMARAGHAIATDGQARSIAEAVVDLIQANHPMANDWALRYAREHAAPDDAQLILLALILAYERGPSEGKARRLDDAVQATRMLHEQDAAAARNLLRPILADEQTDRMLLRGCLLGLVRTDSPDPHRVIEGLTPFNDTASDHLALLLRARHGAELSERQMRRLALLVRGGGSLQDSLRIQAAWTWLKRTGRSEEAIRRALGSL